MAAVAAIVGRGCGLACGALGRTGLTGNFGGAVVVILVAGWVVAVGGADVVAVFGAAVVGGATPGFAVGVAVVDAGGGGVTLGCTVASVGGTFVLFFWKNPLCPSETSANTPAKSAIETTASKMSDVRLMPKATEFARGAVGFVGISWRRTALRPGLGIAISRSSRSSSMFC